MTDQVQVQWTADAILDFLNTHAAELRAMGVVRIGLFGSYVRGEQSPGSDIDLLVTMNNWTWKRWCALWDFLEARLGSTVDIVPEEDLRSELRPRILREVRYAEGL